MYNCSYVFLIVVYQRALRNIFLIDLQSVDVIAILNIEEHIKKVMLCMD